MWSSMKIPSLSKIPLFNHLVPLVSKKLLVTLQDESVNERELMDEVVVVNDDVDVGGGGEDDVDDVKRTADDGDGGGGGDDVEMMTDIIFINYLSLNG